MLLGSFNKVICRYVSKIWCAVVVGEHCAGERLNFRVPYPVNVWRCYFGCAYAAKQRRAPHSAPPAAPAHGYATAKAAGTTASRIAYSSSSM